MTDKLYILGISIKPLIYTLQFWDNDKKYTNVYHVFKEHCYSMVLSSLNFRELLVYVIAFDAAVVRHENTLLTNRFNSPQLFHEFIYDNQYSSNYLQY